MTAFTHWRDHAGADQPKHHKATLFESERLLLGLNCLEPGQQQRVHTHGGQDKFYFVVEGQGDFTVGDERRRAGEGAMVWAPAGVEHGVANPGPGRLTVLVGIAPAPGR